MSRELREEPLELSVSVIHRLRRAASSNPDVESRLDQGYVAIDHHMRQGQRTVSWYRGPLISGGLVSPPEQELAVPVSDRLLIYDPENGMLDVTYAAAWEIGRLLTLQSKAPPFAADGIQLPEYPADAKQWSADLMLMKPLPFHYLVPHERMLPPGSIRFFRVDARWVECMLGGASSVGRATSGGGRQDSGHRGGVATKPPVCSGFILRSPVVTRWPNLQVDAYSEAVPPGSAADHVPAQQTATVLRKERLGEEVLICLFEGQIQTVDIHEHAEAIPFGVEVDPNPDDLSKYYGALRKLDGSLGGVYTRFTADNILMRRAAGSRELENDPQELDVQALAQGPEHPLGSSAEPGVAMIEGVEKVRFLIQSRGAPRES